LSRLAFFRRGLTSECLKANGKLPVEREINNLGDYRKEDRCTVF